MMGEMEQLTVKAITELQQKIDRLEEVIETISQIVEEWNNDASHSFSDMCKINSILKENKKRT